MTLCGVLNKPQYAIPMIFLRNIVVAIVVLTMVYSHVTTVECTKSLDDKYGELWLFPRIQYCVGQNFGKYSCSKNIQVYTTVSYPTSMEFHL